MRASRVQEWILMKYTAGAVQKRIGKEKEEIEYCREREKEILERIGKKFCFVYMFHCLFHHILMYIYADTAALSR